MILTLTVVITSGEGASFELEFDLYGRVINVIIQDAGQYYNDAPSLNIVDREWKR